MVDVLNYYLDSLDVKDNTDIIMRKQIKRNKKCKKQINAYAEMYEAHAEKKKARKV